MLLFSPPRPCVAFRGEAWRGFMPHWGSWVWWFLPRAWREWDSLEARFSQPAGGRDLAGLALDGRSIKVLHAELSRPRRRGIRGSPRPPLLDQIQFRLCGRGCEQAEEDWFDSFIAGL